MVLHTLKQDDAITRSLDNLTEDLEPVSLAQSVFEQLVLNQALGAFLEGFLDFTNANSAKSFPGQCIVRQKAAEELRFPRTAPTICALVSGGFYKRVKYFSRGNIKNPA